MRSALCLTLALCLSLMSGFASAETKIAVVDIQKIMQQSPQMADIQKKLESEFMPRRDKLVKMESELKEKIDKLKRDSTILSEAQKKEMQQAIIKSKQAFDIEGQGYQQELNAAQNKAMQGLYETVKNTVVEMAKNKGYDLVIQKDATTFSSSKLDVTEEILKQLK